MAGTSTQATEILRRLNPITASPSFGYSLMPRTSVHQGMAAGLATLMGRAVGVGVEGVTDVLVSPARPLPARLAATAALGGLGAGLELLPGHEDAALWRAGLRSGDVVMYQGTKGFDHYGIDRALWFGLPGLAKWSRNGMARGASDLVPEGTVGVFDRYEQLAALDDAARQRLRAVVLMHDNDPIGALSPDLLVKRPPWLDGERGRGVPEGAGPP